MNFSSSPNIFKESYDILDNILRRGGYSTLELNRAAASDTVRRIVLGTLDKNFELEYIINNLSESKPKPVIMTLLKMAAYCLLYMDSLKPYAVVNESVKILSSVGKSALSGYVNAILNKIAKREFNLPKEDDKLYLSVKYNKPEWFIEAVKKEYSSADAEKIFCAKPPSGVHIRINGRLYNGQAFERALTENGESFVKSPAGGYFAEISKTVREMFRLGLITYQGVSSMLAVQALSIEQSDDVLDACAAPGGKSVYASELASLGSVTACDVHEHRLDLIKSYAARMRADNVSVEKRDATEFHDDYFEAFDKVLVDAPCSGLGTAPEKPDVLINKTAESIKELPELQLAILKNTAKYLKKGGALVYSTCTLLKAENREVVARFLSEDVGFILEKMDIPIDNAGEVQILPQEGADGFFIAKLRKI